MAFLVLANFADRFMSSLEQYTTSLLYKYKSWSFVRLCAECELEALADFGPSLVGYIGFDINNSGWVLLLHHIFSILLRRLILELPISCCTLPVSGSAPLIQGRLFNEFVILVHLSKYIACFPRLPASRFELKLHWCSPGRKGHLLDFPLRIVFVSFCSKLGCNLGCQKLLHPQFLKCGS